MSTQLPRCSIEQIAARAGQYLEGQIEAEEFRWKLLRALAGADYGTLIALAKAIADNAEENRLRVLGPRLNAGP